MRGAYGQVSKKTRDSLNPMLGGHEKTASVGGLCGAGAGYVCLAAGFVSELAHQDGSMARAFISAFLSGAFAAQVSSVQADASSSRALVIT